jgi:branched-subunit amino acid aminotransferase/4-amino-4-deoxychorismate lyase
MERTEGECGCTAVERRFTISDLKEANEAFCCVTGASVTPVGSVNNIADEEDGTEDPI